MIRRRLVTLTGGGFAMLALVALSGCGEKITVYEAPKDAAPAVAAHGAADPHARPAMPRLTWDQLPAGWIESAGGDMRAATFAINDAGGDKAAEVAVLPFPGAAGLEDMQLVNMWREQLGQDKLSAADLEKQRQVITVGDAEGRMYDIAGGENQIVSVIAPRDGWMWFFKLAGKAEVVAANKPRLLEFLKQVGFAAPATPAPPPAMATPAPSSGTPDWKVPANWTPQAAGMMQLAKFSAAGDGGAAEVSVARLGGMAGGLGPNINRWRGQMGLAAVSDAEAAAMAKPVDVAEGDAQLVEMAGSEQAMSVIMVQQGGATWFYKLTGAPAVVERERAALVEFVNSVKYN